MNKYEQRRHRLTVLKILKLQRRGVKNNILFDRMSIKAW